MHSCLVELGAAGYIPVFETYQLLFIHPFVSACNSARPGFFVSLSPQTVPRIRITEASDLLQSYLFNEMHAFLPYVPKRSLSVRKGLSMALQALFFCQDCALSLTLVSNAGKKWVHISSIPLHAHATLFCPSIYRKIILSPAVPCWLPSHCLAQEAGSRALPLPGRSALAAPPASLGPLSIPAAIRVPEQPCPSSITRAAPALCRHAAPPPRGTPEPGPRCRWRDGGAGSQPGGTDLAIAAGCHGLAWAGLGSSAPAPRPPLPAAPRPPAHGQGGCGCALGCGWAAEASLGLDPPLPEPQPPRAPARALRCRSVCPCRQQRRAVPTGLSPRERGAEEQLGTRCDAQQGMEQSVGSRAGFGVMKHVEPGTRATDPAASWGVTFWRVWCGIESLKPGTFCRPP